MVYLIIILGKKKKKLADTSKLDEKVGISMSFRKLQIIQS
jgi:hypothetical protein